MESSTSSWAKGDIQQAFTDANCPLSFRLWRAGMEWGFGLDFGLQQHERGIKICGLEGKRYVLANTICCVAIFC